MIYFIVLALVAILAVVAYNMYQESQYRKQVREQFGHSDKDALLGSKTDNVRDGWQASGGKGLMSRKAAKPQQNAAMRNLQEQDALFAARVAQAAATKPEVEIAVEDDFTDEPVKHTTIGLNNEMTTQTEDIFAAVSAPDAGRTLVSLDELVQIELPWFDPRFDYLAYIALTEAQELQALPRLSHRWTTASKWPSRFRAYTTKASSWDCKPSAATVWPRAKSWNCSTSRLTPSPN